MLEEQKGDPLHIVREFMKDRSPNRLAGLPRFTAELSATSDTIWCVSWRSCQTLPNAS